ncbi:MAG TPA: PDZ domain-containing protein, partial [Gemmataceae bacterium]|nr:PDZ domain-containing protein [Gemmataceae bacterium]
MTMRWTYGLAALILLAPAACADDDLGDLRDKAVKAAVAQVAPCVVQIETQGGTDMVRGAGGAMIRHGLGPTSGLIVSADGFIISSAFNFANQAQGAQLKIDVSVPGKGKRYTAKLMATDQTRMLTLLKIEENGLPVPAPAPKAEMRIGQTTLALGRTLPDAIDDPPSIAVGILSATGRIWGKAVQTDARISPANYGGPLIDLQGRVLGVVVPASPYAEGQTAGFEMYDSGLGFAVPLVDIDAILPRLKEGTDLKRGILGVNVQTQDPYTTRPIVSTVEPGSAADKAGVQPGDRIAAIDGKPVETQVQLQMALGSKYEGDVIAVKIERDGKPIDLKAVTLGGAVAAFGQGFLGVLPVRDDPGPGVEVRFVYPNSPAEKAGVKAGDRIVKIDCPPLPGQPPGKQPIIDRDRFLDLMAHQRPGVDVKLDVAHKGSDKTETLSAKLGELPADVPTELTGEASAKQAPKKDAKVDLGFFKRASADNTHAYYVYVPEKYDSTIACGLVIWLHPAGKVREDDLKKLQAAWQDYCAANHLILLMPLAESEDGWKRDEAGFVQEAVKAVTDAYAVDKRRVVLHGMGVGGEMAFYLAFHNRDIYRAVATTGAPLA